MKDIIKTQLWVNKLSVDLNAFTEEFVGGTIIGAVSSLKGAENLKQVELSLEAGEIKVAVDGQDLPLSDFPRDILRNTVVALVSSLKEGSPLDSLRILAEVNR